MSVLVGGSSISSYTLALASFSSLGLDYALFRPWRRHAKVVPVNVCSAAFKAAPFTLEWAVGLVEWAAPNLTLLLRMAPHARVRALLAVAAANEAQHERTIHELTSQNTCTLAAQITALAARHQREKVTLINAHNTQLKQERAAADQRVAAAFIEGDDTLCIRAAQWEIRESALHSQLLKQAHLIAQLKVYLRLCCCTIATLFISAAWLAAAPIATATWQQAAAAAEPLAAAWSELYHLGAGASCAGYQAVAAGSSLAATAAPALLAATKANLITLASTCHNSALAAMPSILIAAKAALASATFTVAGVPLLAAAAFCAYYAMSAGIAAALQLLRRLSLSTCKGLAGLCSLGGGINLKAAPTTPTPSSSDWLIKAAVYGRRSSTSSRRDSSASGDQPPFPSPAPWRYLDASDEGGMVGRITPALSRAASFAAGLLPLSRCQSLLPPLSRDYLARRSTSCSGEACTSSGSSGSHNAVDRTTGCSGGKGGRIVILHSTRRIAKQLSGSCSISDALAEASRLEGGGCSAGGGCNGMGNSIGGLAWCLWLWAAGQGGECAVEEQQGGEDDGCLLMGEVCGIELHENIFSVLAGLGEDS